MVSRLYAYLMVMVIDSCPLKFIFISFFFAECFHFELSFKQKRFLKTHIKKTMTVINKFGVFLLSFPATRAHRIAQRVSSPTAAV
jgi:hypothetical protein